MMMMMSSSRMVQQSRIVTLIGILISCCLWVPTTSFMVSTSRTLESFSRLSASTEDDNNLKLEQSKSDLLRLCTSKPSLEAVKKQVQALEEEAELIGVGQLAMESGLLAGEWYESIPNTFYTIV